MEEDKVEIIDSSLALMAIDKAAIDVQIATAKQWPRTLKDFLDTATELCTLDEDTAASMWYSLPARKGGDGKKIEGPGVRMAEVVAYSWKNSRAETNIESIDDSFVTAVGSFFDIERNTAIRVRVKRRITTKDGRRYSDDMIVNTCNSAMSIAFREAVFKGVPRVFVKQLYEKSRAVAIGTQATLVARRLKAFEQFAKMGVHEKVILRKLGRKSVEEVTLEDLAELTGIRTAIRDDVTTAAEAFAEEEAKAGASELTEKVKSAAAAKGKVGPAGPQEKPLDQGGVHPKVTPEQEAAMSAKNGGEVQTEIK